MKNEQTTEIHKVDGDQKAVDSLRQSRIILPVLIGLVSVGFLFWYNFDAESFHAIQWNSRAWFWLFAAFILLIFRHLSYAFRLRALTGYVLSWKKYIELIVLWEFSAALTPTSKGGPFVMMFALPKEGISPGRSTAAVLYAIILDSTFFVTLLPLFWMAFGSDMLFPKALGVNFVSRVFFATFGFMVTYWICFSYFLFLNPALFRRILRWLIRVPFLKKHKESMLALGDDFVRSAKEIKTQPAKIHLSAMLGTLGAWTGKFLMINCIMLAIDPLVPIGGLTQGFIFGRLVAMFIVLAFSFTPGGAGLAEVGLVTFISDFMANDGLGTVVAMIWRGMAFYGYLLVGAFIVPRWIRKKLGNK